VTRRRVLVLVAAVACAAIALVVAVRWRSAPQVPKFTVADDQFRRQGPAEGERPGIVQPVEPGRAPHPGLGAVCHECEIERGQGVANRRDLAPVERSRGHEHAATPERDALADRLRSERREEW